MPTIQIKISDEEKAKIQDIAKHDFLAVGTFLKILAFQRHRAIFGQQAERTGRADNE